jgi:hypothetical protein
MRLMNAVHNLRVKRLSEPFLPTGASEQSPRVSVVAILLIAKPKIGNRMRHSSFLAFNWGSGINTQLSKAARKKFVSEPFLNRD